VTQRPRLLHPSADDDDRADAGRENLATTHLSAVAMFARAFLVSDLGLLVSTNQERLTASRWREYCHC